MGCTVLIYTREEGGDAEWFIRASLPSAPRRAATNPLVVMGIAQQPELGHAVREMGKGEGGVVVVVGMSFKR